jgi:hypothetical protein
MNKHNILLIFFTLTLVTVSIFRLHEYTPSISEAIDGVDDWNRYAKQGLDIKNNGLLISSIKSEYNGPGGFLYNYFVALMFLLFGNKIGPIYIIQSILIGLSVALTFLTFKDLLKESTRYLFLGALFSFAIIDVYINYSHILLSENLGLFLFSTFIYVFLKGVRQMKPKLLLLATMLITLTALVRPNMIPFVPLYFVMSLFYMIRNKHNLSGFIILQCLVIGSVFSLIPLRNYFVTGNFAFLPSEGINDSTGQLLNSSPNDFFQKLLFSFGYLSSLVPEYRVRIHWIIMWVGYFILLVHQIRKIKTIPIWGLFLHMFIATYLFFSIGFSVIESYGYRYMIPINFIILSLSMLGFERLKFLINKKKSLK